MLKELTRHQKKCVRANYLSPNQWKLEKETEFYLKLRNPNTGKRRVIDKFFTGERRKNGYNRL